MADINNIIPNGTKVITKIGGLECLIIGICVRGKNNEHIQYQVSRFANGEYRAEWLEDFEIILADENQKKSGFVDYQSSNKLLK